MTIKHSTLNEIIPLKNKLLKSLKYHQLITAFGLTFGLFGCVETYKLDFTVNQKITIIEGFLTNEGENTPVILKESQPSQTGGSSINPIIGAKVSVIENEKTIINLTEKGEGFYYYPDGFKGKAGSTYQLSFSTPSGGKFESSADVMINPSDIASVYHKMEANGLSDAKGKTSPAFYLYIDTPNAPETEDYFMWDWELYEKQNTCKTCIGGYYYKDPLPFGRCVNDNLLSRYNNIFDYQCSSPCWEIMKSAELVTSSDIFYNGKTIKGQLVGKLPLFTDASALVNIKQYSISKSAYKFLELTRRQGIETGGLADTPPASLVGNVKSTNNVAENVTGYFIVAGNKNALYTLDKKDLSGLGLPMVGLLGGRPTKYEPAAMDTSRPPVAPCVASKTRTNIEPIGWTK